MKPVVALIAPGNMGAAVGKRLTENGLQVLTSLEGRSEESVARARAAGMTDASADQIAAADLILSIVPPGDALALAERLAPALARGNRKPAYVDCNAVNPKTVAGIEAAIAPTACPFVDAGIVGGPPKPGTADPAFYASGAEAPRFAVLNDYGLDVRVLDGGVGAASAMKMSYAGITKGFTALGTVMMLAASRAGTAEALHRELAATQPQLLAWLTRQVPNIQGLPLGRRDGGDRGLRRRGRGGPPNLLRRRQPLRAHRRGLRRRAHGDRRALQIPRPGEEVGWAKAA